MRAIDIIARKRDGHELDRDEIVAFIDGCTRGAIPDYQIAAWLMAIVCRGMTPREATDLALAMAASGQTLDWSVVAPVVADKHSTGGVGDKTTLVVAPLVAAAGLPVAKMSGRGLSFTGGTLDKLESIPGFRVERTVDEMREQVARLGVVIASQTRELAPADGLLYALRDATATVPSIPLIASSIMSKKLAAGANVIVLDVKVGLGAFMKTLDEARALAQLMVRIGEGAGRRVRAVLAAMDQPLGWAIGNALEVVEAVEVLHGRGPRDLREHCLELSAHMLALGGQAASIEEAGRLAERTLSSGQALERLAHCVHAQGGDARVTTAPHTVLPMAPEVTAVVAPREGYLAGLHAEALGLTAMRLGAGRERKGDAIDHGVGMVLHKKVGDAVRAGEPLATIYARDGQSWERASREFLAACTLGDVAVPAPPLVWETIG